MEHKTHLCVQSGDVEESGCQGCEAECLYYRFPKLLRNMGNENPSFSDKSSRTPVDA
jgi:hypothetical protein